MSIKHGRIRQRIELLRILLQRNRRDIRVQLPRVEIAQPLRVLERVLPKDVDAVEVLVPRMHHDGVSVGGVLLLPLLCSGSGLQDLLRGDLEQHDVNVSISAEKIESVRAAAAAATHVDVELLHLVPVSGDTRPNILRIELGHLVLPDHDSLVERPRVRDDAGDEGADVVDVCDEKGHLPGPDDAVRERLERHRRGAPKRDGEDDLHPPADVDGCVGDAVLLDELPDSEFLRLGEMSLAIAKAIGLQRLT